MRVRTLRGNIPPMRGALRLVGGCCLLLAGCGRTSMGSASGTDGGDGTSIEGGTTAGGCVDISHFDDQMREKWDLRVIGTGFDADEGNAVRVVVTAREPSYGLAEVVIGNGSFDVFLPGTIEPYTGIGVYIDRNRNDACDVDDDSLWQMTTGGVYGDYLWEVTPQTRDPAGAQLCNINGIFDLTVPLHCP